MSKTYTVLRKESKNISSNEDWNDESSNILSEFNGQLSADNLPYEDIGTSRFVSPTRKVNVPTKPDETQLLGVGWVGSTQSYYRTSTDLSTFTWDRGVANPNLILGPPIFNMSSSQLSWGTSIYPLSNDYNEGVFLRIPTQEGMLHGVATIDVEYYGFDRTVQGGTGNWGTEGRIQLFVFVNDVAVATTGLQPAGKRQTYSLSFATPIGSSETTTVDIRAFATFDVQSSYGSFPDDAVISFYNSQLWLRNQYR